MAKKPWTPLRAALWSFLGAIVIIGALLFFTLPDRRGESPEANGERVGDLTAPPAIAIAVATYIIVWRRQKRRGG